MAAVEHNFSGALATWKSVNLSELQKTLDAQGVELVENQKESFVGRKALADKTKDFKKISDEEKLTAFKSLLKAYQTEIDNLTKRSKSAENAFLNVYKVLAEAPDPYPLLEAAVDQTVKATEVRDLQAEVQRLRDDNADLRKRNSELSKAGTRVEQLESKMDEMINERVTQKENELHATYDEKIRNFEEREQDLQRQVTLARTQLKELRVSNESNQAKLLDHTQRQDQEVVAKLAELDMMVTDLEHANSRVATVERRNELLRAEIEAIRSGNDTPDRIKDLENHVSELESECERLSRALETQTASANTLEQTMRKKSEEYAREVQGLSAEVDHVKQKLKQYSDYDEVKRELEIMKYVEFAGLEEDQDEDTGSLSELNELGIHLPNPNADKANAQQGKSLEVLLATKNKKILEELTRFRILHGELEASLQVTQEELITVNSKLEKQQQLNEKLENDLLDIEKHQQAQMNGKHDARDILKNAASSDALAGIELGKKPSGSPARTTPIPFASSSADASILPIVTSQRDRFRQRNAELEEELRKQYQIITDLRTDIRSLQGDNLKLYEKVRYMQSYQSEASGSGARGTLDPLPANSGGRPDDISKYRTRYEEAMNPFEVFRGREAARAYSNMNPVEKAVFSLTRAILGNKKARTAFILYACALHLLVMYTTWECALSGSSQSQFQKQHNPF